MVGDETRADRHMLHFNFCDFSGFRKTQLVSHRAKEPRGDVGKGVRMFLGRGRTLCEREGVWGGWW